MREKDAMLSTIFRELGIARHPPQRLNDYKDTIYVILDKLNKWATLSDSPVKAGQYE